MLVTKIEKGKQHLSNIYIEGELFASVDVDVLALYNLSEGVNIEKEQLEELIEKSNDHRAYNKAIYFLGFRDYSTKDLRDKLKLTFPPENIDKAIEKLEKFKLIDDNKFAEKCARTLLFEKRFSKKKVKLELVQKGIEKEFASSVVDSLCFDLDEQDQIRFLISKKYKNAYTDEKTKRRAIAFLQRYGYSLEDIFSVLKEE